MLVWLNKTLPVEKQNLHLLVNLCDKTGTIFDRYCLELFYDFVAELSGQLDDALANITEGICHPLKIRIEKILTQSHPPSVLYSVTNLIRYYKKCICKVCNNVKIMQSTFNCFTHLIVTP